MQMGFKNLHSYWMAIWPSRNGFAYFNQLTLCKYTVFENLYITVGTLRLPGFFSYLLE